MRFVIYEFLAVLWDAWLAAVEAADLRGRLSSWWYVIHHRDVDIGSMYSMPTTRRSERDVVIEPVEGV